MNTVSPNMSESDVNLRFCMNEKDVSQTLHDNFEPKARQCKIINISNIFFKSKRLLRAFLDNIVLIGESQRMLHLNMSWWTDPLELVGNCHFIH